MALIHCNFFSETLNMPSNMYVILPQTEGVHPVLYLLHGLGEDHTVWLRKSSIERYVEKTGLAVVMPEVHRSFYTDMVHGGQYWSFLCEELPRMVRMFFPISDKREDNYAAGLSMGGYGAFKLALSKPECFLAAASLSGGLNMGARIQIQQELKQEWINIFGHADGFKGSKNDLFELVEKVRLSGKDLPRLFQCCGTSDFLYEDNRAFFQHAQNYGMDITYEESEGDHNFEYWDPQIRKVLFWLGY